jgi:hypothetical protein
MGLETATYISGLVDTNPAGSDSITYGDDHLKLIKSVLKATLPYGNAVMDGVKVGATTPTSYAAGSLWYDTSGAGVLKVRNKANSAYEGVDTASAVVPTGVIALWYGAIGSIPSGWALCDGTASTPDLRDRFVVGAGTGGSYAVDATGGSLTTADHTLTTAEIPAHTHEVKIRGYTGEVQSAGDGDYTDEGGLQDSEPTGGGGAHSHTYLPPYYALCYIMKT